MIALLVFVAGAGTAVQLLLGVSGLLRASQERAQALVAVQNVLETLQGEVFGETFARFNATVADDPPLGASPGNSFAVPGLDPRPGDADGLPGEIVFPGGGFVLLENPVDVEVGMPRDLNGDGAIDAADHSGDYRVLPVRIRVLWRGAGGDQELEIATALTNVRNVP